MTTGIIKNNDDEDRYHKSAARRGEILDKDRLVGHVEVDPSTRTTAQDNSPTSNARGAVNTNAPTLKIAFKLNRSLLYPS